MLKLNRAAFEACSGQNRGRTSAAEKKHRRIIWAGKEESSQAIVSFTLIVLDRFPAFTLFNGSVVRIKGERLVCVLYTYRCSLFRIFQWIQRKTNVSTSSNSIVEPKKRRYKKVFLLTKSSS